MLVTIAGAYRGVAVAASSGGGGGASTDLLTLNVANDGTPGYIYWDYDSDYAGAFRLPNGDAYGSETANDFFYTDFPAIGMGSTSGHLFVVGRDIGGTSITETFAEVSIPTLSTSATMSSLNIASVTQNFVNIRTLAPLDTGTWDNGINIASVNNIDGRLFITAHPYYDSVDHPLLVVDDPSDLAGSDWHGFFNTTNQHRSAGWATPIPAEFQSDLGGDTLFGYSMAGTRAILSRFSMGPSAYVYDSATALPSDGGTVTMVPVLDYPAGANGLTAEADLGDSGTMWTYCSGGEIGFIVPGTRTYMVIGFSAGHATGAQYWDPTPPWGDFKGYGPIEEYDADNHYWLYDVDDLIDVKNGVITNAYEPVPYEHGVFDSRYNGGSGWNSCRKIVGGALDSANGKLYLSYARADATQSGESSLPLIICYDISGIAA